MKVLVFGATGTAGGSVLRACLQASDVEEVRAIVRRPLNFEHAKLKVFVHQDYGNYALIKHAFLDVDACLFCLGISALQVPDEKAYRKITYDFSLAAAQMLKEQSPHAAFHYISGQGTRLDSRQMWARVKGETERDLMALGTATCWRPAFIDGGPSDHGPRIYRTLRPVAKLLKPFRSLYVSGEDLGRAMLQAMKDDLRGRVIENPEIRELAGKGRQAK